MFLSNIKISVKIRSEFDIKEQRINQSKFRYSNPLPPELSTQLCHFYDDRALTGSTHVIFLQTVPQNKQL